MHGCDALSLAGLLAAAQLTAAYTLDLGSIDSIKSIASSMTEDMMSFYTGHQLGGVPGLLPDPYYWWEGGALMGALIDYWYYTNDTQWNDVAEEGLLFQVGPNNDYMPPNQTRTEGNDDQGFWGMSVMSAAEYNFQNPPEDKPQWLALAQAVFNTQAARWEDQGCSGGLRWQIFTWNNGYTYKNSISQACFFNIAARLARYTGNASYAEWAERTWDWMTTTSLMNAETYDIYDGIHIDNCSNITPYQWTYNTGAFLLGAAAMYNYTTNITQKALWRDRVDGLLNGSAVFFTGPNNNIMTEVACEPVDLCDLDQQSFKAYLSRWMAATVKWAPWTYGRVKPLLEASAVAATATCTGGENGRMCGLKWNGNGSWDGSTGVGQQMAAMEVVLANMISETKFPVANGTGGTSKGDPGAGGRDYGPMGMDWKPVSAAGRAGAYVLTVLVVVGLVVGSVFVLVEENADSSTVEQLMKLGSVVMMVGGSCSFSKLALSRQNNSRPEEKGKRIVPSSSDGSAGGVPVPVSDPEKGPMKYGLPRAAAKSSTSLRPHPTPILRRVRSEGLMGESASRHRGGTGLNRERNGETNGKEREQQPSSSRGTNDKSVLQEDVPQRGRRRNGGRVQWMETHWEGE